MTPQVSAIRPSTNRQMTISLYTMDLPVGDRPMFLALVGPSDRIAGNDFVSLCDQILDRDVKVGEGPMEPAEHLFQQFRAGRFNRQWRAD